MIFAKGKLGNIGDYNMIEAYDKIQPNTTESATTNIWDYEII